MDIIWNGALLDPSGYGNCARQYVKALYKKHNVFVKNAKYFNGNPYEYISDVDFFKSLKFEGIDSKYIYVEHKTPGALNRFKHKLDIGYTVWETDRIPDRFVNNCNSKDMLWTPSEFSKKAFLNAGVSVPIHIIPHIIDTSLFKPARRKSDKIVFLFNGEFTLRKGVDILLKAFMKAFSQNSDVELLLKTHLLDIRTYRYIEKSVKDIRDSLNVGYFPLIKMSTRLIPDDRMKLIYDRADIFVTATRGEGFGLPIAEALASGLKVIAPDKGGHLEFCNKSNSLLVDSEVVDISDDKLEPTREVYKGQKWIETSEEALIEAFRFMYRNFDGVRKVPENIKEYNGENIVKLMEDKCQSQE